MTSLTFFFIFIPILTLILLTVNIVLSPHNPYQEKNSAFECGFHSFLGQNRTQFSISFFIFALLFLLFDLEILLLYPFITSFSSFLYKINNFPLFLERGDSFNFITTISTASSAVDKIYLNKAGINLLEPLAVTGH